MRYSHHARIRMTRLKLSDHEIDEAIASPKRGRYLPIARDTIERFHTTTTDPQINVVTDRAKTVVITVVEQ